MLPEFGFHKLSLKSMKNFCRLKVTASIPSRQTDMQILSHNIKCFQHAGNKKATKYSLF